MVYIIKKLKKIWHNKAVHGADAEPEQEDLDAYGVSLIPVEGAQGAVDRHGQAILDEDLHETVNDVSIVANAERWFYFCAFNNGEDLSKRAREKWLAEDPRIDRAM